MQQQVVSRWFRLADLVFVLVGGTIWYIWPQASFWPVLLAIPGWVARVTARSFPFKPRVIHLLLLVFLVTAGIGVWAGPQREAAWGKFWILVAGVLIFYSLADQPLENLWLVAGLAGLFGVCLAISFISFNDWQSQPSDLRILERITSALSRIGSGLPVRAIHPNLVGGILAMVFPFPLALGLHAWKTQRSNLAMASALASGVIALGLALTSSRGAWLALFIALVSWFSWAISRKFLSHAGGSQRTLVLAGLLLAVILLGWFAFSSLDRLAGLSDRLPGMNTGESRIRLAGSAIKLIQDFPFTGGGLRSFAGLYSQYIQVTPFFLFEHSHNFYLDVLLEQGFLGFVALMGVLFASLWRVAEGLWVNRTPDGFDLLRGAAWVGLVAILLHGLVDDALYGGHGTPLVFLVAGMGFALNRWELEADPLSVLQPEKAVRQPSGSRSQVWAAAILALLGLFLVFLEGPRQILAANWYANLGAVEMSRLELANWPTNRWAEGKDVSKFARARALFDRSLTFDPGNRTANHRLGLIAMQEQDFQGAAVFLEKATLADPEHRGVRKVLGYSYAWSGGSTQAAEILEEFPEAKFEFERYIRWWRRQGRPDLSVQARFMTTLLQNSTQ